MYTRYQRCLVQVKGRQGMKLTTHLHLVLRLKMNEAIPPFPIGLHGVYRAKFTFTFNSLSYDLDIFSVYSRSDFFCGHCWGEGGWVFFVPLVFKLLTTE
jgi:hypothetical protein